MKVKKCRVCGGSFDKKEKLVLKNMPKAAQFMPDKSNVKNEKGVDLEVVKCAECGTVQLTNEPVKYYKDVIRAVGVSPSMREFRKKQFASFLKKYSLKNKKILEIGCGEGDYLEIMKKAGGRVYGIENSGKSARACRPRGLNVHKGFVRDRNYRIKNAPFDGFFIMNFLEHIPGARELLLGVSANLKKGGIGIVEVPNFGMMAEKKLYAEIISDHIFYFTADTLKNLLNISGFIVLECEPAWNDYIISAVVKKADHPGVSEAGIYMEKLKKEVNKYIDKLREKNKKAAIWGAGHQAFTVMSVCGPGNRIEYVVDSAPFKQGKFTPATHIPIVPPETLEKSPVDVVIVMAGGYSGEVAGIIRKKYPSVKNIAVFRDNKIINKN